MATVSQIERYNSNVLKGIKELSSGLSIMVVAVDGSKVQISYDDFIDALITAGVGGGGWTDTTVTDADFTAADDTRYYLPASVLTANRVVDVSGITTKVAFVVAEDPFRVRLTFTGATVYTYGGAETTDGVPGRWSSVFEIIDGNLIQTQ